MAMEAVRLTGGVVLPPLPLGTETYTDAERLRHRGFTGNERIYGMDYPGFSLPSLYIEESAMGVIVHEIIRALKRQEFRVIVITNGHGATNHRATLQRIAVEQSEPGRGAVLLAGYFYDTNYRILDRPTIVGEPSPGFAVVPEWDPRNATAERGRSDVAGEARSIAAKVREALVSVGVGR